MMKWNEPFYNGQYRAHGLQVSADSGHTWQKIDDDGDFPWGRNLICDNQGNFHSSTHVNEPYVGVSVNRC